MINNFEKLYRGSVEYPRLVSSIGLVFIVVSLVGLMSIEKNTSVEAFIPTDHVSVQTRDQVKDIFGLKDPIVLSALSGDELRVIRIKVRGR